MKNPLLIFFNFLSFDASSLFSQKLSSTIFWPISCVMQLPFNHAKKKKKKKKDSISNFRLTFLWIFYLRKPKLGFRLTPCKGTKIGPENIRGDVLSTIVGARYKGQCGLMGSSFHEKQSAQSSKLGRNQKN